MRKNLSNALMAIGCVTGITAIAIWQFYQFVTYKNLMGIADNQGGINHLWMAIGAGLIACIAGFWVFSFFLRYDKKNELYITYHGAR